MPRAAALVPALFAVLLVSGCASTVRPGGDATAAIAAAAGSAGGVPDAAAIPPAPKTVLAAYAPGATPLDGLIVYYANAYGVPERLVRRVIVRESNYNPAARNGPYWGLMQILHATARTMGYRGSAAGLLDAETNLRYAVRYLAGAYLVAGGNEDRAVRFYASGYYYDAKRAGLLEESGLR